MSRNQCEIACIFKFIVVSSITHVVESLNSEFGNAAFILVNIVKGGTVKNSNYLNLSFFVFGGYLTIQNDLETLNFVIDVFVRNNMELANLKSFLFLSVSNHLFLSNLS